MQVRSERRNDFSPRGWLRLTVRAVVLFSLTGLTVAVQAEKQTSTSPQIITLVPGEPSATIEEGLFGYLIEPYGRNVEGIWVGEDSTIPHQEGFRLDTLQAFRRLGPTVVRFPGGTYAETYHWEDGIGPRAERPRTFNYYWGGEEDNHFGTGEFLRYCELVGAESWIKVNLLTDDLGDALKWMQYCNYEGTTHWANLRRAHGHPEPYGVKYWSTNNSATDAFSPERYAELVNQWTFFMRQVDQQSKLVVRGNDPTWNERFVARYADLRKSGDTSRDPLFHYLALFYPGSDKALTGTAGLLDRYLGANRTDVVVEEWVVRGKSFWSPPPGWKFSYPMEYHDPGFHESHVHVKQALDTAVQLHRFMKHADRVKLATFLYGQNLWGALIRTDGPRFHLTPNYHTFDLLKQHKGARLIGVEMDPASGLNVVASTDKQGQRVTVSVINRGEEKSVEALLRISGSTAGPLTKASVMVLTGDPADENTFDRPDKVQPTAGRAQRSPAGWHLTCPPASLTVVTLEGG